MANAKKWPFDPGRPPSLIPLADGRVAVTMSALQAKEFFLSLANDYLRAAGSMAGVAGKGDSAKIHRLASEYLAEQAGLAELSELVSIRKEQDFLPNETTKDYLERMQTLEERRARRKDLP